MRTLEETRPLLLMLLLAGHAGCSSDALGLGADRDAFVPSECGPSCVDAGPTHEEDLWTVGLEPPIEACAQQDTASTTEVRIHVRNDAADDRLIADPHGWAWSGWCASFGLTTAAGAGVPTEVGWQCGCECPAPAGVFANHYVRIKPGETRELAIWDGRGLKGCTSTLDCGGWPSATLETFHREPVAAGSYRVTVAVEHSPPPSCTTTDDIDYSCTWQGEGGWNGGQLPGSTLALCPSSETASAELSLPWTGTVDVTVSIQ